MGVRGCWGDLFHVSCLSLISPMGWVFAGWGSCPRQEQEGQNSRPPQELCTRHVVLFLFLFLNGRVLGFF